MEKLEETWDIFRRVDVDRLVGSSREEHIFICLHRSSGITCSREALGSHSHGASWLIEGKYAIFHCG